MSYFDQYVGTRPSSVDPQVTEYFNKANNLGFSNEQQLFGYATQLSGTSIGSWDQYNSYMPKTSGATSIPADTLGSQTSVNVSQPSPDLTGANGMVAGATQTAKTLQDYLNQLNAPTTALDTQNQALTDRLSTLYGQDTGKAQALNTAETNAGVPDLQKQLQDITNSINIKNAEYNSLNTPEEGKPITMN